MVIRPLVCRLLSRFVRREQDRRIWFCPLEIEGKLPSFRSYLSCSETDDILCFASHRAVPQATEFLDAPLTKKEKGGKPKKKDTTAKAGSFNMTAGFLSQPLGADAIIPAGASGAVISAAPTSFVPSDGSAPPASIPSAPSAPSGFKRIAGSGEPGSGFASPAPASGADDRGKVAFGFSAIGKRKGTADDDGAPPPKRR